MSSIESELIFDPRAGFEDRSRLFVYQLTTLFLSALLFRLLYNACRELVPDEAYYWVWSRHLSGSYLDHPPMVAYLIFAATKLMGSTEFAVRLPAAILSSGTVVLTTLLVHRLTRSQLATWLAAMLLVTSPILTMTGTLMTPDTPLFFFVMLGLFVGSILFDGTPRSLLSQTGWWCLTGICCGLAMLSKYTGVFLPLAVFLVIVISPANRPQLRRPGFYLAMLLTFAIFFPVLQWNAQHHWVSFRFQAAHGLGDAKAKGVITFVSFIGGLLLTWTPVVLVVSFVAMESLLRQYGSLDNPRRLILLTTVLPLLLFAYSSFHQKAEANWPAVAFAPGVVLLAIWAAERLPERQGWLRLGWKIALGFTIVAHLPELALLVHLHVAPAEEVFGWQTLARWVDQKRDGAPVVASNYQNAAELSFYLEDQPDVWSINVHRRSNAYDYFAGKPDLSRLDHVAFIGCDAAEIDRQFPTHASSDLIVTHMGQTIRKRTLTLASRAEK